MQLTNTPEERISGIIEAQRAYFKSGATLDPKFRKEMLQRLAAGMKDWESRICDALRIDLHKSYQEAVLTETSIVNEEIRTHLRHVCRWSRPQRACTPLKMFPSRSRIVKEPLGNTLIISPWNYPVQLLLNPLVGAISSGCTAILKPSPYVPTVSRVIEEMVSSIFEERYVAVVQGNRDVNSYLLDQRFDLIFFTGSPLLGKTVMKAASKYLTPVILELGGKSPCIVDRMADIRTAAKRIAWGKTLNCGQTCIAPDYLILHSEVKDEFIREYKLAINELHGENIQEDEHYGRIVNAKAFERLEGYLSNGDVIFGGQRDRESRYFSPTLIDNVPLDSPVMTEEIFGPIFPIVTISDNNFIDKVVEFVTSREKPLALYYFGSERDGREVVRRTSSGGCCINDTIMHIANAKVPFGGVGNSGMGHYHGRESFEAFSHKRSLITTGTLIDLPFRYMPYRMFSLVKKIL